MGKNFRVDKLHIKHHEKNTIGRDFVVGDIHGHFSQLQAVLDKVEFDEEKDRLFSVGDLIDRGPESHMVVEWLKKPWFHAVRGNHDDFAIRHALIAPLDTTGYIRNGGAWFLSTPKDEQVTIADYLNTLPIGQSVDTDEGLIGIVHADMPFRTWKKLVDIINSDLSRTKLRPYTDYLMWSRERFSFGDESVIEDLHALIVGHQSTPEPKKLGNVHYIDTVRYGKFTLVRIQ